MQYASAQPGHPRGVVKWVIPFLVVLVLAFGFLVYKIIQKDVTIIVDGKSTETQSLKQTVGDVLKEKGITVYPKDKVTPALTTRMAQEQTIRITRAFWAEVRADGRTVRMEILPSTVQEILKEANLTLGPKDVVEPGLNQKVSKDSPVIQISRIREEFITRKEKIAYRTEKKQDGELERGIRRIASRGKDGVKEETLKLTYKDGKIIRREIVSTKVLQEPVNQVIAFGTIQFASRGGRRFEFERALVVSASAYTHTGRHTACGTMPKVGTVAVDPSQVPLGSKLYVEGYGFAKAEDTGGAIHGQKIDVFLETEAEARRWGRRTVKAYILK